MGIHAINLGVYSYALRNQYKYDFFCGKQLLFFFFWFYFLRLNGVVSSK